MSTLDPAKSPIFVVGTGRSGTTLLRMMLSAHPRIYLTHEASFYLWETGFPLKKRGPEAYIEHYANSFSFRWLRLGPELLDTLPPLTDALHPLYTAVMKAKAAQYGKPRWGDKTPSHSAHLGRIFDDYPDARVVRIIRDPRDVVASLARMPWGTRSLCGGATFCKLEEKQTAPFKDRILEIRLEDLLADPRAVMGKVLAHVGEEWSEQVLDHPTFGPPAEDLPPVPWFQSATKAPRSGPVEPRWRTAYTAAELRFLEEQTADCLEPYGYALATLDEPASRVAIWRSWLGDLPEYWRFLFFFLRLAWASKDTSAADGETRSRRLLAKLNPRSWELYPGFSMPPTPELKDGWQAALRAREDAQT
ncbi:MAG: sulfotransferase [Proteobacteria bacterium]|nr:sulfotransferase [Pseudomonadota bacterium]